MKTIMYKILVTIMVLFCINGCSDDEWGIDAQPLVPIPSCENNSSDAVEAKALLVPSGTVVSQINGATKIRVWHFQNSQKAICILKGEAVSVRSK